jgi:hypothetical protein
MSRFWPSAIIAAKAMHEFMHHLLAVIDVPVPLAKDIWLACTQL